MEHWRLFLIFIFILEHNSEWRLRGVVKNRTTKTIQIRAGGNDYGAGGGYFIGVVVGVASSTGYRGHRSQNTLPRT